MARQVRVQPFDAVFHLVLGPAERRALATKHNLDFEDDRPAMGEVHKFRDSDGVPFFVMYLPRKRNEHTLWHEALHMATAMMDHFGVELSLNNDEVLAHLQSHIVMEVDKSAYSRPTKPKSR